MRAVSGPTGWLHRPALQTGAAGRLLRGGFPFPPDRLAAPAGSLDGLGEGYWSPSSPLPSPLVSIISGPGRARQGQRRRGSPAFLVQSGCGLEESSREPRTPLRSLRVGLLGMWGFLRGIGLVIRRQEFSPAHITITVESAKVGAPCPSCGRVSRSRHSRYTRLLMDLPADGRTVNIQLLVRRFRCRNPACRRRVFAERFPQLVRPHARRTERLENLLTRIGVLLGGEAGARLSQDLHVPVSPDTMCVSFIAWSSPRWSVCVWSASTSGRGAKV